MGDGRLGTSHSWDTIQKKILPGLFDDFPCTVMDNWADWCSWIVPKSSKESIGLAIEQDSRIRGKSVSWNFKKINSKILLEPSLVLPVCNFERKYD